ncbi:MAG: ABC transporter permease [Eubacteriales bacterium]
MKFSQAVKMAFVSLKGNKMRSFLTMLGIIIGVLAVTLLISVVQGATDEITGQVEGLGSNLVLGQIVSPKPVYITVDDALALEGTGGIKTVSVSKSTEANVKAGTESTGVSVEGISSKYSVVMNHDLLYGRFLTALDVEAKTQNAVIGYTVAKDLYGTTNCIGNTIDVKGKDFTVVGVLDEGDSMVTSSDSTVYIPILTYQRLLNDKELGAIYVSAESPDMVDTAEKTLDEYLLKELGDDDYYRVINQSAILEVMDQVLGIMGSLLTGIAAISLLVGGIGIMNIMLVSVSERTREIGIRKAIGAQKSDIMVQFLIESVALSVAGGLIGLLLGVVGLQIFEKVMDLDLALTISTTALAIGFSAGVGIVFGIGPANKAANLNPIEALRYE